MTIAVGIENQTPPSSINTKPVAFGTTDSIFFPSSKGDSVPRMKRHKKDDYTWLFSIHSIEIWKVVQVLLIPFLFQFSMIHSI